MSERTRPSPGWYRDKIKSLADLDNPIGPLSRLGDEVEANEKQGEYLAIAFGTLVRLKRRENRLSMTQLATKLDVEEVEIHSIEHDPHYRARPRTITKIATFFQLPVGELIKLSGVKAVNDGVFQERALKFAAHSDDMGALTKDERELLHKFVDYLRDRG